VGPGAVLSLCLGLAGCAASSKDAVRPTLVSTDAHRSADGIHMVVKAPDDCPVCVLYETNRGSVVRIRSSTGIGTGLVVGQGRIVTNAHVVGTDSEVAVETNHGTVFHASILRSEVPHDLALLSADQADIKWFPAKMVMSSRTPRIGSAVFVIGHPVGLGWTLTEGVVSGTRIAGEVGQFELLQIDAAVSPGNSGGPALDANGQWLGLVSSKLVGPGLENISFVIPAKEVRAFLARAEIPEKK